MNAVVVLIIGFIVFFIGYRFYAKYIDTKIIKADAKRATPAKMYNDGVEFMPTSKNILFGYQFKSIAGAGPINGPSLPHNGDGFLRCFGLFSEPSSLDGFRTIRLPWSR